MAVGMVVVEAGGVVAAAGADFWLSAGLPLQALSNKSPAKPPVSKQEREEFRINEKEKGENRRTFVFWCLVLGAWCLVLGC
jgi:hypothetical protein